MSVSKSLRAAMTQVGPHVARERTQTERAVAWMRSLPARARTAPLADPDPGPPPAMPDLRQVMMDARQKSLKVGGIALGVAAWMETFKVYEEYKSGDPITFGKVWKSTVRVTMRGWSASQSASRRHISIVAVDAAARVVAWQAARRAAKSSTWRIVHVISKGVAGNAGRIFLAVDVFTTMAKDIRRYREGDLAENDFYRNVALTGVAVAAPTLGSSLGPVGATAGLTVAIAAGMMRK